jgi:hypothetical protein
MEAPGTVPDSINCHACGAVLSLAGHDAFTHVECPQCAALSVVPLQFGNFLLLHTVGTGGMGTVYKAIDLTLSRYVALKILRRKLAVNTEFIENFSREAQSAASVNHPNVAQVYSFGEQDGQWYLSMELLEHGSLDERIIQRGRLPEEEVLPIGIQIASGLEAAHQRGLLHRDVKPGNILFNEEGLPKIVDFGLARAAALPEASDSGAPAQIWGTPYYIAPEKLRGKPEDFRSDLYSLGATLFHALAGRPPFEAETADQIATKHALQPAVSLKTYCPEVHDRTAALIGRMMAKNPGERYDSYAALVQDLRQAQQTLSAAAATPLIVAKSGERVSIWMVISTGVLMLLCAVAIWYLWVNVLSTPTERPAPTRPAPSAPAVTQPTPSAAPPARPTVDFNADAAWVTDWREATAELAGRNFDVAMLRYENIRRVAVRGQNPLLDHWMYFYRGLALAADTRRDRRDEARKDFSLARIPDVPPEVPATVTTENFVGVLAHLMLGAIALPDMTAAAPQFPPWAQSLFYFCAGLLHEERAQYEAAAAMYRKYHALSADGQDGWALALQPLADTLARRIEEMPATLDRIQALAAQRKFDDALSLIQTAAAATPFASFQAELEQRRQQIEQQKQAWREELQREQQLQEQRRREAQERIRAEEEAQLARGLGPEVAVYWPRYDFGSVLARYRQLQPRLQTPRGQRLLEQKIAAVNVLIEFKNQLAADFARLPYDREDLQTRTAARVPGRLAGASDTELVFITQYGEARTPWAEMPPLSLVRLAEHYAAASARTEPPETRARRFLRLAVFAKQYGSDQAAAAYAQQAIRLQPALQAELDLILGAEPE